MSRSQQNKRERETKRGREIYIHTHKEREIHTHTKRERERDVQQAIICNKVINAEQVYTQFCVYLHLCQRKCNQIYAINTRIFHLFTKNVNTLDTH